MVNKRNVVTVLFIWSSFISSSFSAEPPNLCYNLDGSTRNLQVEADEYCITLSATAVYQYTIERRITDNVWYGCYQEDILLARKNFLCDKVKPIPTVNDIKNNGKECANSLSPYVAAN